MLLNIGSNTVINRKEIIGIFDFDSATVKKQTVKFLKRAQDEGKVEQIGTDLPKSFILTKKGKKDKVYFTTLSTSALSGRIKNKFI